MLPIILLNLRVYPRTQLCAKMLQHCQLFYLPKILRKVAGGGGAGKKIAHT
jgi:hypothetical protein